MSHLYYANKEIQFLFESDDLSEIDYLLKNGLDINSCDIFNHNALFTANFEKTKFLVDRGINIFQKSYYDRTSIMSSYRKKQDIKKVKYLINKGLTPTKNHPYLLHSNSIEVLEYFISNYNCDVLQINSEGLNTLFFTNRESAEFMISKGVDPFYKDPTYDLTTLFSNDLETLELLISKGVDPFHIDNNKENLLFSVYDKKTMEYLINLGVDPYHKNNEGKNCLFSDLSLDSLEFLLSNYDFNIHQQFSNGENLLFSCQDVEVMDYLIKNGVNPSLVLNDGKTLIDYAPIECIPYLLNTGILKTYNGPTYNRLCFTHYFNNNNIHNLIIKQQIKEKHNINIISISHKRNLLLDNINDSNLSCELIKSGINLHYIFFCKRFNEHFLSFVKDYNVYKLAKEYGLFENKEYNLFLEEGDFLSNIQQNPEIFNDVIAQNLKIKNILFYKFPTHKIKHFINNGINVNALDNRGEENTPLLTTIDIKRFLCLVNHGADLNYTNSKNIFEHLCFLHKKHKYNIIHMLKLLKEKGLSLKQIHENSKKTILKPYLFDRHLPYSYHFFKLILSSKDPEEALLIFKEEIKYIDFSELKDIDSKPLLSFIIKNDYIIENMNYDNIFSLYNKALSVYHYKQENTPENIHLINYFHSYIVKNKSIFKNHIEKHFYYFQELPASEYIQPNEFITTIISELQDILFSEQPKLFYKSPYIENLIINENLIKNGFDIHKKFFNNENILFKLLNIQSIKKCIELGVDNNIINYEGMDFISRKIFTDTKNFNFDIIQNLIKIKPNFKRDNHYNINCLDALKEKNHAYYDIINNLLEEIELNKSFKQLKKNDNINRL